MCIRDRHYVSPEVVFGQWNTSCVNICMPQAFEFLQCRYDCCANALGNFKNMRKWVQSLCAPLLPFRSELKENDYHSTTESLQYRQDVRHIAHYHTRKHPISYTRSSENHNNTCAENRIIVIFWTTCIANGVFSLVIMGNVTHILPVLQWLGSAVVVLWNLILCPGAIWRRIEKFEYRCTTTYHPL